METFTLRYTSTFKRQFKKLPIAFQEQYKIRIRLFLTTPTHSNLRLHPLKGAYQGYWSININGDVRALFRKDKNTIIFSDVGTHSQLYG